MPHLLDEESTLGQLRLALLHLLLGIGLECI